MPHLHKLAGLLIICAVLAGVYLPAESGRAKPTAARHRGRHAATGAVRANELGQIPVLMYHRVMAKPQSPLDRTPAQVRAEFVYLAKDGYVPITATEYVTGKIDIPAGSHPVVLTFDEGSDTQFALDAQGNPAQDTAVWLLQDVARQYPDFRPVATFFVNQNPFNLGGRAGEAMRWLVAHGFEIGNHTAHLRDLRNLSREEIQQEIGGGQKMITDLGAPAPTTFAFPSGALSRADLSWAQQGQAAGATWDFNGMFVAGWQPANSPFAKDFDPRQIERIRSADKIKEGDCERFCSTAWLEWLDKNPDQRYTSDGDPRVISYPAAKSGLLAPRFRGLGRAY